MGAEDVEVVAKVRARSPLVAAVDASAVVERALGQLQASGATIVQLNVMALGDR